MSVIDIEELDQKTIAFLRRVRERNETIEIADGDEVIARVVPSLPTGARYMTVDQLAELLTRSPDEDPPESETTRAARRAETEAVIANLDRVAAEIAKDWPEGVSAVDAIRADRSRLDEDPETRRARTRAALEEFKLIGKKISATWPEGVSAVDAVRDVRREL